MVSVLTDDRLTIGTFIRQARMRTRPDQFPSLVNRRRHVNHLTQDDLAELADLSLAVVAQIETGRYENINPAVISKLARALQLDWQQERYLLNFLQPHINQQQPPSSGITDGIRSVVDRAEPNPAVLINARFDILYWNLAATKLLGDFSQIPPEQRNVLWSMFGMPQMREIWDEWESNARNMVAGIKMISSRNPVWRQAILELAGDISKACPDFARFWTEEDPGMQPNMTKGYNHPVFGAMKIYQTVTEIAGSPDLSYILFTPADDRTAGKFDRM